MPATLQDIADRTGVSVSTVSRVLNGKADVYRIGTETAALVHGTAEELGYRPNLLARGLRLKKSNTLGLLAPDVSNPFFADITRRVQSVAHDLGYSVIVCNTNESLELEIDHMNLLFRNRPDGLIAMPVGQVYAHFDDWIDKGRPLVMLDRCFDEVNANSVVVDNYTGAYEAVRHLISFGHERIAIIQGLPHTFTNVARVRGYRDAMSSSDLPIDEGLIVGGDFRQENGYTETKLLLTMRDRPTAIFASSDLITLGALKAIYEEGLDVPRDISLVTFDDFDFAPYLKCPATVVQQPKELMGEIAVRMLVDEMTGVRQAPKRVTLPAKLIVRESVAPPPGGRAAR